MQESIRSGPPVKEPVRSSIIVPTYKRPIYLGKALCSILAQDCPGLHEVLILDNDCDPMIERKIKKLGLEGSFRVKYIPVPEPGLHSGRHAGALASSADILIFVDDDIETAPNWLQTIMDAFEDPDVHLVGGRYLPSYEGSPPEWMEAFWTKGKRGWAMCGHLSLLDYGERFCPIDPGFVWGLSYAIRKETLFEVGGFHPDGMPWELRRFRGDGETAVSNEIRRRGLKAVYDPKALVYHAVPKERMTIEYFERRAHLQGISDSYTLVRQEHYGSETKVAKCSWDWKEPLRKMRRMAGRVYRRLSMDPHREIKERVARAYRAGFEFHQNEVRNDPALLKWVLKPDYWDYRLPTAGKREDGERR